MFALVGFEAPNRAAEEIHDPTRIVPRIVAVSDVTSALCYLVPIFAIVAVLQHVSTPTTNRGDVLRPPIGIAAAKVATLRLW